MTFKSSQNSSNFSNSEYFGLEDREMMEVYKKGAWRHQKYMLEKKSKSTGKTLISWALTRPDSIDLVKDILVAGPSLKSKDIKGCSPFMHLLSHPECTSELILEFLQRGASIDDGITTDVIQRPNQSEHGEEIPKDPLRPWLDTSFRGRSTLEIYLQNQRTMSNKRAGFDLLIDEAIQCDKFKQVTYYCWEALLSRYPERLSSNSWPDKEENVVEKNAILEMLNHLIELGTNFKDESSRSNLPMLSMALQNGAFELVPVLIDAGAELNGRILDKTPLAQCAKAIIYALEWMEDDDRCDFEQKLNAVKDTVYLLIKSGADPELKLQVNYPKDKQNFWDMLEAHSFSAPLSFEMKSKLEKEQLISKIPDFKGIIPTARSRL